MTGKTGKRDQNSTPKGSEIPIGEWLEQIGATEIRYVGGGSGPPDFIVKYLDQRIAVEATLLHSSQGWGKEKEHAFEQYLKRLIEDVSREKNAPCWHSRCEYDPVEPNPPSQKSKNWQDKGP